MNTDIFGANLYHRYLTRQRSGRSVAGIAAAITGRGAQTCELEMENEDVNVSAEECHSILVQVNLSYRRFTSYVSETRNVSFLFYNRLVFTMPLLILFPIIHREIFYLLRGV